MKQLKQLIHELVYIPLINVTCFPFRGHIESLWSNCIETFSSVKHMHLQIPIQTFSRIPIFQTFYTNNHTSTQCNIYKV